jgi:hypothetical protein
VAQKRCWRQQKVSSPGPGARRMQRMVYQTELKEGGAGGRVHRRGSRPSGRQRNLRGHSGFLGGESSPSIHGADRLCNREIRSRGSHLRRGKTEKRRAKVAQKRC